MSAGINLDNERYDRNARDMHRARRRMLRRLVEIRIKRDHRQIEVARALGVNRSTISRFEHELENANPTLDTVLRYAHAVGAAVTLEAETIEEADARKFSYQVTSTSGWVDSAPSWTPVVSQ